MTDTFEYYWKNDKQKCKQYLFEVSCKQKVMVEIYKVESLKILNV